MRGTSLWKLLHWVDTPLVYMIPIDNKKNVSVAVSRVRKKVKRKTEVVQQRLTKNESII
jgi:hypothetical protein